MGEAAREEARAARRAGFRAAAAGFVAGCLAAPALGPAFLLAPAAGVPALLAAGLAVPRARRAWAWGFLALAAASAGWLLASHELRSLAHTEDATRALVSAGKTELVVRVVSAVRMSDTGATFEGELLAVGGQAVGPYGIRAYFPGNVRPPPGSTVEGLASLGRPEGSGGADMARSFRVREIFLSAYFPSPRVTTGRPGLVWEFREAVKRSMAETHPQPARGAIAGILLGDGTLLSKEVVSDFRVAGLSHMLVASGSNIVIVILALSILSKRIPGPLAPALPAAGAVLFAALAGGDVPVVRAAIMGLAVSALRWGGLRADGGHVLLATLCAFAVVDPLAPAWDPSLRLSFCATAGALYLAGPIQRRLGFLPEAFGAREITAAALAASVSTLPVAAWDFGTVSIAAAPANLLAGWAVAPTMGFGALATIFGWCPPLRAAIAFPAWVSAEWIVQTAHAAAAVPGASVRVGAWAGWAAAALMAGAAAWPARKKAGGVPAGKAAA